MDQEDSKRRRRWVECNYKKIDYYLTQAFKGHGLYRTYTKGFGKEKAASCVSVVSMEPADASD